MKLKRLLKNPVVVGIAFLAIIFVAIWFDKRSFWTYQTKEWYRMFSYRVLHSHGATGNFVKQLNVKWHKQEHALSCEIAALKMALSVYGVDVPESELIQNLKFDLTPRRNGVWGDPYKGFVGKIDGQMGVTGYGVYWDPIAEVGNKYLPTKTKRFDSPADLAKEIAMGHPVVVWGFYGKGRQISWNTPAGIRINGILGEHARTIGGFDGDVNNPTRFIVYDPIYGKLSWSAAEVFENWNHFENMGVVVYPKDDSLLDNLLKIE